MAKPREGKKREMKENEPSVKLAPELVTEDGGGRITGLPSLLSRRPKEKLESREIQGKPHRSGNEDTFRSFEEYEGVKEILHPGRNPAELDARTDLNVSQILVFSKARVLAKRFGIKYLDEYVTYIERMSLSKNRRSRTEHVRALSGAIAQDQAGQSLLQKLG